MPRYNIGETVIVNGKPGRVVWLHEDPNEIQAMDEYILEFDDKERLFIVGGQLEAGSLGRIA